MRYSEIATLPGTPEEAKNTVMDIVALYQSLNKDEVPLKVIMKALHRQKFDIDRRLLIDFIKNESPIESISDGIIHLKKHASEEEDSDTVAVDNKEKNKKKVEKMAKKAIDKKGS